MVAIMRMRIGTLSMLLAVAVALGANAVPVRAQERLFTPVTQEMLLDPDPADWINWRRTLDGWGYSPLDQIDTENAHRLQLAWSWAIGSEGRPEPNPLVYDGVLYIASPFGIVEALDAASGELLWRYRHEHESDELAGIVTTRNLAISTTRSTSPPWMRTSWRSTPVQVKSCGTSPAPTTGSGSATRPGPSSSTAG